MEETYQVLSQYLPAMEVEAICSGLRLDVFLAFAVAKKKEERGEPAVDRKYKYDMQALLRGVPPDSIPIPIP